MALFGKRNKQRDDVPEEIQEYYDAEESDRTGVAWLLAFATLVVTILLAAGIFFAGRWTYHKIAGTDKNKSTETAQNESNQQANKQNEQSTNSSSQNEGSGNLEEERKTTQEQNTRETGEEQDQSTRQQTPVSGNTGVSGENIPNTGPGDTLAIFIAISTVGYIIHRLYITKKA